jgi:hypothetical protein
MIPCTSPLIEDMISNLSGDCVGFEILAEANYIFWSIVTVCLKSMDVSKKCLASTFDPDGRGKMFHHRLDGLDRLFNSYEDSLQHDY